MLCIVLARSVQEAGCTCRGEPTLVGYGLGLAEPRWSTDSGIHRLSSSNTTNHLLDIGCITFEDGPKPWNYISLVAPWIQGQYTLVHRIPRIKLILVQHSVLILYFLNVGEAGLGR